MRETMIVLRRELKDSIDAGSAQTIARDYKSALQERLQALGFDLPDYRVSGETGPDHRKVFSVEAEQLEEITVTSDGETTTWRSAGSTPTSSCARGPSSGSSPATRTPPTPS